MLTAVPGGPEAGVTDEIEGGGVALTTVKSEVLVAVPAGVVIAILPLTAFCGTAVSTRVLETTLKTAEAPPIVTLVVPVRFVPVTVTVAPGCPALGENDDTVGGPETSKPDAEVAVPHGVETEIGPVAAPCGTDVSIRVGETTLKTADVPPKATAVAPAKFEPVILTVVPG
jgi:hypothetical protein